MLKSLPKHQIESPKTKCAVIFYQTDKFFISCVLCEIVTLHLPEFIEHFHNGHMEDFGDLQQEQQNTNTNPAALDPLEDVCKETVVTEEIEQLAVETIHINDLMYEATEDDGNTTVSSRSTPLDSVDNDGDKSPKTEQIDWSKPYNPNSLRNHNRRPYKPRNKPIACTYCGRTFRRRYQLDSHLNIHTGRKPHQCEICGRQFRAVTTLQRHRSTHEQRDIPKCKYCEKTFTHRAAMVSHEMRHTQERTVPCEICKKMFYTHNQMDTHKRKVHANAADDAAGLPFACDLCEKRYRSASMLSTHKYKKHYKTAKFECDKCNKKFVNQEQMQEHQKIHFLSQATV